MASVPTPGDWLFQQLSAQGISHAAVARRIGRSRTEVTRWLSGREQIPRLHLAEIADQFGRPGDLRYALTLKDCEDAQDYLLRTCARLARRLHAPSAEVSVQFLAAVDAVRNEGLPAGEQLQQEIHLLLTAAFAAGQWLSFAENVGANLFTADSIGRHLVYPLNHFVGTLLTPGQTRSASFIRITREAGLANLRTLAKGTPLTSRIPLIRHHAIHMLARYGEENDRETVLEMLTQGLQSDDALFRRLGYSGLIMAEEGDETLADKYLHLLMHDAQLASVDLAFDATHYGDLPLGADGQLREPLVFAPMVVRNITKHYQHPAAYSALAEIDAFRALSVLELCQPATVPDDIKTSLIACIDSSTITPSGGAFQKLLCRDIQRLRSLAPPVPARRGRSTAGDHSGVVADADEDFDLFIAYSSADLRFVQDVYQCLTAQGLRCWIDFENMPLGLPHQESMASGLASSRVCLAVLSDDFGNWQRLELQIAVTHFVEGGKPVIPFLISGSEFPSWVPPFMREFHGVILERHADLDAACARIARSLRGR